eukprot:scaffold110757_cov21-Tisochrysis_lutea.AAC.4
MLIRNSTNAKSSQVSAPQQISHLIKLRTNDFTFCSANGSKKARPKRTCMPDQGYACKGSVYAPDQGCASMHGQRAPGECTGRALPESLTGVHMVLAVPECAHGSCHFKMCPGCISPECA